MMIGIDGNTKLVYEGQTGFGYGLWPTPMLSVATIVSDSVELRTLPTSADLFSAQIVFREDSFDPVTRIRRGRLYRTPSTQPQTWRVLLHTNIQGPGQPITMPLHGFDSNFMASERDKLKNALLALGSADAYTLWRVVGIERIVTGEDLLTLRARSSLGVLPELNESAVPVDARAKVVETLGKLSEAAYRAGPESIVDRARDVAQWCIGTWFSNRENDAKLRLIDLWVLAGKVPEDDFAVIRNIARSLARLHARVKPNVQEEKNTRPVSEDDAEFALAAVGMLLREIGWAR